ncbi:MAG TPA: GNAT family N-acetyltransferase [Actinomycetota bacterium]|jgi:GNAT superfamily N-acetyltransferase|nr:GNAT family N-acetyltransferase [Actinomycetota bacterium]
MAVVIRSPIPDDAARLAEAWTEFGRYYAALDPTMFRVPDVEGLEGWIRTAIGGPPDEDRLWLVAEVDGTVQGYVQAEISRPGQDSRWELLADLRQSVLRVLALFVFDGDRREGIASELMRAAESWAKQRGATRAFLNTYAHSPSAVPFHEEGMGYAPNITGYWKQL